MTNLLPAGIPNLPAPASMNPEGLSKKAKAAIIVQFILNEGSDLDLSELPEAHQAQLTTLLAHMRYVDRETLNSVISEFADQLDMVGMSFPGDMASALNALDGKISTRTATRLRREAGVRQIGDPWKRINEMPQEKLIELVDSESTEIAAVMLSKINTDKASKILSAMPGDKARRISLAVSMTTDISPDSVDRIGISLATQLDQMPIPAFKNKPNERLGAILNYSASEKRETLLQDIGEENSEFAEAVRKALFTFANIPDRVNPKDVPKITRDVDQETLAIAIGTSGSEEDKRATEFLLENISKRMAQTLREEGAEHLNAKPKVAEKAKAEVVGVIRELLNVGEIKMVEEDDD